MLAKRPNLHALAGGSGLLIAVALGVAAVKSPLVAVACAACVVFVAFTLRDLAAGVALFTLLAFFEAIPGAQTMGFGVMKLVGGVLAVFWFPLALSPVRQVRLLLSEHPVVSSSALFLVAWAFASQLWASDLAQAEIAAGRLALGVALLFIAYSAIREPRHLRWVMLVFVAGAALSAALGVGDLGAPTAAGPHAETARLAGGVGDPNELAAVLVPALAFTTFAHAVVAKRMGRWLLVGAMGMLALSLFLTESRGGIIAAVVMLFYGLCFGGPLRRRALVTTVLVGTLGVSYFFFLAPKSSLDRVTSTAQTGGSQRVYLWLLATEMIRDRPLVGIGAANFRAVGPVYASRTTANLNHAIVSKGQIAHNAYLELLAELGVVGLTAFLGVVGGALGASTRALRHFVREGDREMELLARSLISGIVGLLTAFFFISGQYELHLWLLLGLAIALVSLAEDRAVARAAR